MDERDIAVTCVLGAILFVLGVVTGVASDADYRYGRCLADIKEMDLPFIQKRWDFEHKVQQ